MTTAIDEIKTVIVLSGNRRLPDLEAEIFADNELTTLYLHNLCKDEEWYDRCDSNAAVAHYYADEIIGGRWTEGEAVIATDAWAAYFHARDIIGGRWPEGEAVIATDPLYACRYATVVIKHRWTEAEHLIKTDGSYWQWYCEEFCITDE